MSPAPPDAVPAGLAAAFNIQGPGGWVGYFFGKSVLQRLLGAVGSLILISGVYVTSLILMTGLRPIHIVRQTVSSIRALGSEAPRLAIESASCAAPI